MMRFSLIWTSEGRGTMQHWARWIPYSCPFTIEFGECLYTAVAVLRRACSRSLVSRHSRSLARLTDTEGDARIAALKAKEGRRGGS